MWRGKITTKLDPATRTLTFYQWMASAGGEGGVRGPELLKIEIFTTQGWVSGKGTGGFFRLTSKDKLVFAASIPSPRNSLSLTQEEIRGAFKLIDQE